MLTIREHCSPSTAHYAKEYAMTATPATRRHIETDTATATILNRLVAWLTRRGVGLAGSWLLEVRGRRSGEWRSTPVNPLRLDGADYLVAPRGHTQWVRNLRAAGEGQLRRGRRVERFTAIEVGDEDKPEVLREYLRRWKWQVGAFFEGLDIDATDGSFIAVAAGYPVFRITQRSD